MASLKDLFDDAADESGDGEDFKPGDEAEEAAEGEEGSPPPSPEGEGDDLEDSSEEEAEGEDNYDMTDKFLADEDEDGGGSGSEGEEGAQRRRKKRRRHSEKLELEEEDYDLLEENQVTGIRRPRKAERKRIRKQTEDAGAEADGKQRTALERVQEQLGFANEAEGLEDVLEDDAPAPAPQQQQPEEYFDDEDEEDEFADFIVDDDGGEPRQRRPIGAARRRADLGHIPAAALREAQDIFGDVSELFDLYNARPRGGAAAADGDEGAELDEDDFDDEGAAEQYRLEREERARAKADARARAQVEPTLMEAHHMLPEDERLRATDAPERLQLQRGRDPEHDDPAEAAEWIYEAMFGQDGPAWRRERELVEDGVIEVDGPPPGAPDRFRHGELVGNIEQLRGHRGLRQVRGRAERRDWRKDRIAQQRLKDSIQAVVRLLWADNREVPLIAAYHKEAAGELLAMRREDQPETTDRNEARRRTDRQLPEAPEGTVQAKHRRIRRYEALWGVYTASLKWRALQRRREARAAVFRASLDKAPEPEQPALQEALNALEAAQSLEAIADADAKHRLAVAAADATTGLEELSLSQDGRGPRRRGGGTAAFVAGRRAGLDGLVAALGLTPAQLAENMEVEYKKHEPEDLRVPPPEVAAEHISDAAGFTDAEAILARARAMAAQQIAVEPVVRDFVRRELTKLVGVTTDLTPAGESVVDAFHPYGRVARLRSKPLERLQETDHFLRAVLAEREGLLTIQLAWNEQQLDEKVTRQLREWYLSDSVSTVSQAWNSQRRLVLEEAVTRGLLPGLRAELRGRLVAEAREVVAGRAAEALWKLAAAPPLKVRDSRAGDEEEISDRRVAAAVWGPGGTGQPATTIVMLDPQGGLVDLLLCSQLSGHIPRPPKGHAREAGEAGFYSIFTDPRKGKDAERIKSFLVEHAPHVVAVGATGLEARQLKADLDTIRDNILEHNARVMTAQETGNIDVQYMEEGVAAVWADCSAAREEMGDQPPWVRQAVALGRCLLEPLPVLASLCGQGREVLALPLDPLQSALPQEDLLRVVEQTLVTVVNQVGVDINLAASNQWMASTLQFVAGLGPRKARALLQAVTRAAGVETRHALYSELGVLGPNVFLNAGPFLRVRRSSAEMTNADLMVLDDTRVQPRHYKYAIQIAASAMNQADPEDTDAGEANALVEAAMADPNGLEALDLALYIRHLDERGEFSAAKGLSQSVMVDICMELLQPYMELRPERDPPREEEVFWMLLAGEREALKIGRLVEARVRAVSSGAAFCTLPDLAGLDAIVRSDDVSSQGPVDPRDRMKVGDVIKGRIKEVEPVNFLVQLTTKSADLLDEGSEWEHRYCATDEDGGADQYYEVLNKEKIRRAEAAAAREKRKKVLIPRPIKHPHFTNKTAVDAINWLAARKNDCEFLFRPSPRGTNMLQMTMRLGEELYTNTEIKEGSKEGGGGMGSHLKLGLPLKIQIHGHEEPLEFDDLDDVVANYAEPYIKYYKALLDHPKFQKGIWMKDNAPGGIQDELRRQKAVSRGRAVYCLGIRYDYPGMYFLGHILHDTPRREAFSITPKGYYLRSQFFRKLDHLINEFKRQPVPDRVSTEADLDFQAAPEAVPAIMPEASERPPPPPPQQQPYGGANGFPAQPAAAPAAAAPWAQPAARAAAAPDRYDRSAAVPPPPPTAAYQQPQQYSQSYAPQQQAYAPQQQPYGQSAYAPPPPQQQYPQSQQYSQQQQQQQSQQYGGSQQQHAGSAAAAAPQQQQTQQQRADFAATAQAQAQALAAQFQAQAAARAAGGAQQRAQQPQQQGAYVPPGVPPPPPPSYPAYAGR